MALIEWTPALSLNIDMIDEQHKTLVDMINNFYDELNNKSSKELIGKLITQMKDYTHTHFKAEEELFLSYGYKDSAAHIKTHKDFIAKVNDLETRYKENKLIISFEVTNFLKDWLINHIQKTDKEYAKVIKAAN